MKMEHMIPVGDAAGAVDVDVGGRMDCNYGTEEAFDC